MSDEEIKKFYEQIGVAGVRPTEQFALERPQFVNAENPRIQYFVRLSGTTQPLQPGSNLYAQLD